LELLGIVLGGSTMAYTGLLLSFARGRPFWASPFLPWTFIISGSLTGLVTALLLIPIIAWFMPRFFDEFKELVDNRRRFTDMLIRGQKFIMIMILIELALVIIEVGSGHGGSLFNYGSLSMIFFVYIVLGLIAPLGIAYYSQKVEYKLIVPTSLISFIFVLVGGFLLRYVILTAGQLIL
jgi:formate-dependent nitrite reductase membrane component NrfD